MFRIKKSIIITSEMTQLLLVFSCWNTENNFNKSWLRYTTGTLLIAEDCCCSVHTYSLHSLTQNSIFLAKFVLPEIL